MPVLCGCGQYFANSGFRQHQRSSKSEICRRPPPPIVCDKEPILEAHSKRADTPNAFEVTDLLGGDTFDSQGDYFGDYGDLDSELEADEADRMMGSDGEEWDFPQTSVAEEQGLEPERTQIEQTVIPMDDEDGVPMRLRGGVDNDLQKNPFIVAYPDLQAGEILSKRGCNMDTEYTARIGDHPTNPYFPFKSKIDWEMVHWAKTRGPSSTAFTELMQIENLSEKLGILFTNSKELNAMIDDHLPGRPQFKRHEILVGGEVCEVFYRDVVACIRALFGDPDFMPYLVFRPEKHYVDETKAERMFHDMHTGRWWWSTQEELDKTNPGATIIPIIISSDKTQLTLFRNKSAYPLYLTIGNIPKEIRRKPSKRAYVLLAYLPVTKLKGVTNKASRCRQLANLYHACLSHILAPLRLAGLDGIFLTSGDGCIHRSHLLLASFIGDYPEQILVTGTKSGCPTCPAKPNELGMYARNDPSSWLKDLDAILKAIDSFDSNPGGFLQACKEVGLKPIVDPFWKDLPYAHIYRFITPDILHQLLQGVLKHVISWITEACGAPEIDARCRRMPPNHNVRLFLKGITTLSRVTGQEHDQMCRILLGLVIDLPLPGGVSNTRLIWAVRAILDFLYLAQYPVHTDRSLELLEDALEEFHSNKAIFIDLGIRDSFNIPKLHFAKHYVRFIKLYGTLDNFNTEYTERLHIDLAKDAYEATNHKDEFQQMTVWLERKEKILRHHQYVQWRLQGTPPPSVADWTPPGLELDRGLHMTKHASIPNVLLSQIKVNYGATHFREALARFVVLQNQPDVTRAELERKLWDLPVWHWIKFQRTDPSNNKILTADSIHCQPQRLDGNQNVIPAQFDTAFVNDGTGEVVGVEGYRVARIRVVFSLPESSLEVLFNDGIEVSQHLVFVEWFSAFVNPERNHGLFKIRPLKNLGDGSPITEVVPLVNIRRSAHLYPQFGPFAPVEWTSSTVLDKCDTFFVNTFADRHMYRIVVV
ncbi:hypothetical protein BDN71DRAFT_1485414 [Pleurotus eryngii]|uniref:Transposase n=1 Tax=Pleurotus eryngii TaxID=5323 RepID=A0A9P5ZFT7_PLEER|nr:hypothetical protein BDN71DRAFT_1485414 [Pleurotus eryngii]